MHSLLEYKLTILPVFIAGALACSAFLPEIQAAPDGFIAPPPDGCYPNFTTAEGCNALQSLTTGVGNTGLGAFALFSTSTGNTNTAVGAGALDLNNGDSNTAVGTAALLLNTTGTENTATGTAALENNSTGSDNTANGAFALFNNDDGFNNNAVGHNSLFSNTTGVANNALGNFALHDNIDGNFNVAIGDSALFENTHGNENTAVGAQALQHNTTSSDNTAVGGGALFSNTTGNFNTAVGTQTLVAVTTGSGNVALGQDAGSQVNAGSNVICIGNPGADESNTTWIGNVFGVTTVSGTTAPVIVSDGGQLGTVASSERFKKDIATMENASETILSLRPVTFHYKTDTKGTPQFGLIAEEVAKVNSALVLPDKEGKPYTVRYDAVNAMLLNEFLKEHRKNEQMQKQIEALTEGLQKVSAQLEVSKAAPQTVLNNH